MSLLVISKSLTKDKYINPQAHSQLTKKMRKRDPTTAPAKGDRVPYVIVQGLDSTPIYDKAEDPIFVLNNGLTIDSNYYLNNQLLNPIERIFTPIMDNPKKFFMYGKHTHQITRGGGKTSGPITMFTKVEKKCLSCQISIPDVAGSSPLCRNCIENAPEVYQRFLNRVRIKEREFSRLWTQCQDCQGSYNQAVLCTARDCPIFYMRTQVKQELSQSRDNLKLFDW